MKGRTFTQQHKKRRPRELSAPVFPLRHETVAEKREAAGKCPECGASESCYSCASRGGWISEREQDELDRAPL